MLSPEEMLGRALRRLLHGCGTLFLTWQSEASDDVKISANVVDNGVRRSIDTDDPVLLMMGILGEMKHKTCQGPCGEKKPLTAFSADKNSADGRAAICLQCERERAKKKRK